jgi:hypothetical protein
VNLASDIPASVPKITARVAEIVATFKLVNIADIKSSSFHSSEYHLAEKPPQTVTSLESLNE